MVAKDTDQAPGAGVETDGEACIPFDAADQIEICYAKGWTDGLRIGLVENTKRNSEELLLKLAARLEAAHGMTVAHLVHKPQRAPIRDDQIAELTGLSDFVICGVGD